MNNSGHKFRHFRVQFFIQKILHKKCIFHQDLHVKSTPDGALLHLKMSCCWLGMLPRKIILVINSTFSRELFHHAKNFPGRNLDTVTTKWPKNSGPSRYIHNLAGKTWDSENKLLSFLSMSQKIRKFMSSSEFFQPPTSCALHPYYS